MLFPSPIPHGLHPHHPLSPPLERQIIDLNDLNETDLLRYEDMGLLPLSPEENMDLVMQHRMGQLGMQRAMSPGVFAGPVMPIAPVRPIQPLPVNAAQYGNGGPGIVPVNPAG